jgi:hypothetical protein
MLLFLKRLVLILPLLVIISVVNYTLDKKNLFQDIQIEKAVDLILSGNAVQGLSVQNRFDLNLSYIKRSNTCPDVLLIGASDCERMNKRHFPNKSIINHWTPGCGLHYQTAIIGLYKEKGCLPKEVIFSFRPFILSKPPRKNFGQIKNSYLKMRDHLGLNTPEFIEDMVFKATNALSQLFSVKYLIFNLKKDREKVEPLSKDTDYSKAYTLPDLSTQNTFDHRMKLSLKLIEETKMPYIEAMANRKEEYEILHMKLIQYLLQNNVKVSLFVMPFHPKLMQDKAFSEKMGKWESYCERLPSKLDVQIIGSVFSLKYGLVAEDFLDPTHISDKGLDKIFRYHQLLEN